MDGGRSFEDALGSVSSNEGGKEERDDILLQSTTEDLEEASKMVRGGG
jgi:hypothetical protein